MEDLPSIAKRLSIDTMIRNHIELGKEGELKAIEYLRDKGYELLEQNYRNRIGEIDLIAREKDYLCFIEVKTRISENQGHPFEAVNYRKQRQIIRTSLLYLTENNIDEQNVRFDVVAVIPQEQGNMAIDLIQNAFEL